MLLQLSHDEPKLVFLALVYHLGRPGSELDPDTKQPSERGLRDIKTRLGNALDAPDAVIDVDETQYRRMLSAILGSVNELRVMHMRSGEAGGTAGSAGSGVPRFTETARSLFPALGGEPEAALDLAESMMMLHRRMERAVSRAAAAEASEPDTGRRRWPFRRR